MYKILRQSDLAIGHFFHTQGLTLDWHFANLRGMQKSGAERLEEYRLKHGYKQYELADLIDVHEAYLSQLLDGKRRPGLPTSMRIERVTGIPAESWLLTGVSKTRGTTEKQADSEPISKA